MIKVSIRENNKVLDSLIIGGSPVRVETDKNFVHREGNLGCFYGVERVMTFDAKASLDVIIHEFIEAVKSVYVGPQSAIPHELIYTLAAGLAGIFYQLGIEIEPVLEEENAKSL